MTRLQDAYARLLNDMVDDRYRSFQHDQRAVRIREARAWGVAAMIGVIVCWIVRHW